MQDARWDGRVEWMERADWAGLALSDNLLVTRVCCKLNRCLFELSRCMYGCQSSPDGYDVLEAPMASLDVLTEVVRSWLHPISPSNLIHLAWAIRAEISRYGMSNPSFEVAGARLARRDLIKWTRRYRSSRSDQPPSRREGDVWTSDSSCWAGEHTEDLSRENDGWTPNTSEGRAVASSTSERQKVHVISTRQRENAFARGQDRLENGKSLTTGR